MLSVHSCDHASENCGRTIGFVFISPELLGLYHISMVIRVLSGNDRVNRVGILGGLD